MNAAAPSAWSDYFPPGEFNPNDRRALLIDDLVKFFTSDTGCSFVQALRPCVDGSYVLLVDYTELEAKSGLPDVPAALDGSPVEALGCVAVAAHEVGPVCQCAHTCIRARKQSQLL
jgi:DNA helicase MCM8